jgi:hypothetical protein
VITQRTLIAHPETGTSAAPVIWTMDEGAQVREFLTPEEVVRWVKRRDRAATRRGVSTMTTIEWRGMPDGFTPPE